MNVFFSDAEIFCLHWNNSRIEKRGVGGGSKKIQENQTTITHINTFIKIRSINSFKSWLLMIRLVNWQMCSVSSNPPKETPASTSRPPASPRYLPILQIFKEIYIFQYFFGRSIIKLLIMILYTKKQLHFDSISLFLLMAPPSLVPSVIF